MADVARDARRSNDFIVQFERENGRRHVKDVVQLGS
jgi:hypothetical protein